MSEPSLDEKIQKFKESLNNLKNIVDKEDNSRSTIDLTAFVDSIDSLLKNKPKILKYDKTGASPPALTSGTKTTAPGTKTTAPGTKSTTKGIPDIPEGNFTMEQFNELIKFLHRLKNFIKKTEDIINGGKTETPETSKKRLTLIKDYQKYTKDMINYLENQSAKQKDLKDKDLNSLPAFKLLKTVNDNLIKQINSLSEKLSGSSSKTSKVEPKVKPTVSKNLEGINKIKQLLTLYEDYKSPSLDNINFGDKKYQKILRESCGWKGAQEDTDLFIRQQLFSFFNDTKNELQKKIDEKIQGFLRTRVTTRTYCETPNKSMITQDSIQEDPSPTLQVPVKYNNIIEFLKSKQTQDIPDYKCYDVTPVTVGATQEKTYDLNNTDYLITTLETYDQFGNLNVSNFKILDNFNFGDDYVIFAIIAHTGGLAAGHYIAYIKQEEKWYKANDIKNSFIKHNLQIKNNEITVDSGEKPYVIFYKKKTVKLNKVPTKAIQWYNNSCYISASIQVFFRIEPYWDMLQSIINDASATKGDTSATTSDTSATTSDTSATTSDTSATTSDTSAKTSDTSAKTSDTSAKTSDASATTSDASATTSDASATTSDASAKNYDFEGKGNSSVIMTFMGRYTGTKETTVKDYANVNKQKLVLYSANSSNAGAWDSSKTNGGRSPYGGGQAEDVHTLENTYGIAAGNESSGPFDNVADALEKITQSYIQLQKDLRNKESLKKYNMEVSQPGNKNNLGYYAGSWGQSLDNLGDYDKIKKIYPELKYNKEKLENVKSKPNLLNLLNLLLRKWFESKKVN